jgi:hypothetical protein
LTLVVLSLLIGFRTMWVRTPWQSFLIASYLSFLGLALEALIVDTDHWRHFYLLLGVVWGLVAATRKAFHDGPLGLSRRERVVKTGLLIS